MLEQERLILNSCGNIHFVQLSIPAKPMYTPRKDQCGGGGRGLNGCDSGAGQKDGNFIPSP